MLIKQSNGKPSGSFTIAIISFIYCLIAITVGIAEEITIGSTTLRFRMIDSGTIMALLVPAYGLYGFRRYVETKEVEVKEFEAEELKK